jgi:alkaline phosphatase D
LRIRAPHTAGMLVLGLALPAVADAAPRGFADGVAAGEVTRSSAMLWTRADSSGSVVLKVSRVAALTRCSSLRPAEGVRRRSLTAAARNDNTVRTTVRNLRPGTRYFYRFCRDADTRSALGRFTTAPERASTERIRFGLTGDADGTINPATGAPAYNRFEVYRRMAAERNDFNVNLGDIMYSDTAVAGVPPALTLQEKWAKYRLNLTYPNLRRLRSAAALYSHWDDHEFIDDFSVPSHGLDLFRAGATAFLDYNPARYRRSTGLYRSFRWGRNVELFFLDERSFRSLSAGRTPACFNQSVGAPDPWPQLPPRLRELVGSQLQLPSAFRAPVAPECIAVLNDASRTLLGAAQLRAFTRAVQRSTATFKVIVNEVPIQSIYWDPYDRWEGYEAERRALLTTLSQRVRNVVFLTTDFHANLVNHVRLATFPEEGGPIDTGIFDIVTGPVALKTMAVDTDLKTRPGVSEILRALFRAPPPNGLGMSCAALDVYSYAQVDVTARRLSVTLKDAQGRRVKETPSGPSCARVDIPRR